METMFWLEHLHGIAGLKPTLALILISYLRNGTLGPFVAFGPTGTMSSVTGVLANPAKKQGRFPDGTPGFKTFMSLFQVRIDFPS